MGCDPNNSRGCWKYIWKLALLTCECHGIFQEFLLVPKVEYALVVFIDTFVERMQSGSLWVQVHVSSSLNLWITHLYAHHSTRSTVYFKVLLFSGILALVQVACPKHTFGWCFYTMHGSLNSICVNMFSEARAAVHVLFSHLQWWILVPFFLCGLRRHVYLRGALPPPGTEGYFLLTDEEDRSQIKGKPLTQSHPTEKGSSWHDSNHYLFGGYLELQGCTGTLLKLLMLLLLDSLVRKVLDKEAEACHQINVIWLPWLRRCLALSSEQLHGQWITKVYCNCRIAFIYTVYIYIYNRSFFQRWL